MIDIMYRNHRYYLEKEKSPRTYIGGAVSFNMAATEESRCIVLYRALPCRVMSRRALPLDLSLLVPMLAGESIVAVADVVV
jgi:hypothetical protein